MSETEFVDLVGRMRASQLAFFRTRKPEHLNEAKQLEGQVDIEIRKRRGNSDGQLEFPF
jgi:hypothetical protein